MGPKALSPDQLGDRALRGRLAAHEALSSSEILNSALEIEGIEVGEDLVGEEGQLAKRVLANGAFVREVQRIVGEIEATVDVLSGNRKKKKKAPQKKEAKSKKVVRKGPDEGVKDDEEASDAESWNSRDFDDANMVASDSSASGSGDEDGIQFDGELEAGSDAEMSDVYSSSYGSDAGDSESEVDEREIAGRNKGGRGKSRGKDFQDLEKPRNRMGQRARRL